MSKITISQNNISITIEGKSDEGSFCQDLYINAIKLLIEEADITGWEKHNQDFDVYSNFLTSILTSITHSHIRAVDYFPFNEGFTTRKVLLPLIEDLKLDKIITEDDIWKADE